MLNLIKKDLQQIAETIKAIVDIDVTIMDNKLKRVAGTGKLKKDIDKFAPRNSVFEKSIKTGKKYFIEFPGESVECMDCESKGCCDEKAEVCFPIKTDEGIVGAIGMIIFDEEQKKDFLKKQDRYEDFDKRMGELISLKIKESNMKNKLEHKSIELLTVIDSVAEGIIITDEFNNILSANKCIKDKLNLDIDIINKKITSIIPKNIVDKLPRVDSCINEEEVTIKRENTTYNFLVSIKEINIKGERKGAVFTFKDFDKMQRSVFKMNEKGSFITFDKIIGSSNVFTQVKEQAKVIAKRDVSVLIMGESGTGKELFARALHFESNRRNEIFMPINCGAIPESLVESELFGYEKGAFTGANKNGKMGKFQLAKDGTIFLDELGELPLHIQVKLLRVLEEKEITPIGGREPIKVNPRIIAATNRNLYDMVKKGEFREDLFYRLNVIPLTIPPLKERGEDIFKLSINFLNRFNYIYNKKIKGFTKDAKKVLMNYPWPGNVRELQNLIEYAIHFEKSNIITLDTISKRINIKKKTSNKDLSLKDMVSNYEKKVINDLINEYGEDTESKKKIAKKLKISPATLYRKMND